MELTDRGFIRVNPATLETTAKGIYAIGDVAGPPMLAHKGSREGVHVAEVIAGQKPHAIRYDNVPSVTYCHPEVASIGLTEAQAKEKGLEFTIGKFPFSANSRARCLGETEGLVKLIADARTDRILGVHIFGPRASELIGEMVLAMEYAASAEDVARTCHAHPTLSEALHEAALAAGGRALHL